MITFTASAAPANRRKRIEKTKAADKPKPRASANVIESANPMVLRPKTANEP